MSSGRGNLDSGTGLALSVFVAARWGVVRPDVFIGRSMKNMLLKLPCYIFWVMAVYYYSFVFFLSLNHEMVWVGTG